MSWISRTVLCLGVLALSGHGAIADGGARKTFPLAHSGMIMTVEKGVRVWRPRTPSGILAGMRGAGSHAGDGKPPPYWMADPGPFYPQYHGHHSGGYDHGVRGYSGGYSSGGFVPGLGLGYPSFGGIHRRGGYGPHVHRGAIQPLPGWVARPPVRTLPFGNRMPVGRGRH